MSVNYSSVVLKDVSYMKKYYVGELPGKMYSYVIKEEAEDNPKYILIYEENKYNYVDLFEEGYSLQKRKTNE